MDFTDSGFSVQKVLSLFFLGRWLKGVFWFIR